MKKRYSYFNATQIIGCLLLPGLIIFLAGCMPGERPVETVQPAATAAPLTMLPSSATKITPSKIYRESGGTFVYFNGCLDLDEGSGFAGTAPGCDLLVQADVEKGGRIAVSPLERARFALDEPLSSHPQADQCRTSARLSHDPEIFTPLLSSDYCYQTGTGRYGYMRFKEIASNGVLFEWHTFDTPVIASSTGSTMETTGATTDTPFPLLATQPTETMPPYWTYSEGFNRYLNFNFCFDLDNGEDSDTAKPGCDFFIYRGAGSLYDQIEYVPSPPAMVTFWNSFDDPPGFSDCRRAPAYTSQVTTIAPLELGYLCYQTGGGRFGYLRFINASADVVTIDWHTFDPPLAQIQASSLPVNPATSDLKPPAGQPVWQDSFDDDNNWTIYQDEHASFTIEEGYLTITVRRADSRESRLLTWQRMSDFYLEATFKAENCSGLNNYGLHVRAGKDEAEADGYMFSVSCNGLYSLRRRSGSVTKILIPWTQVPDFLPSASQAHRPGILAQGDHLALFLDGSLLGDIKDDTFSSGVFGPFISAVETPGYRVDVDQIAAWALK